ncbi:MAG: hypothetical protein V4527_18880 [Pseudomonadota bacterium]
MRTRDAIRALKIIEAALDRGDDYPTILHWLEANGFAIAALPKKR